MNLVWTRSEHKGSELLLLLAIADNANDDGFAFPGINLLARKMRLTPRAVQYVLKKLLTDEDRELDIVKRGGQGRANEYQIRTKTLRLRPDALGLPLDENGGIHKTKPASPQPSENRKKEEADASSRVRKPKPRDPLFDALAVACDFRLDAMTKEASRLCAIAAAEIRKAGGEPEMIRGAVANYRRLYVGAAATPKAIANHWPAIAPKTSSATAPCPECGVGGGQHLADCATLAA